MGLMFNSYVKFTTIEGVSNTLISQAYEILFINLFEAVILKCN